MRLAINIALAIIITGCYVYSGVLYKQTVAYHAGQIDLYSSMVDELQAEKADNIMMIDQLTVSLKLMEERLDKKYATQATITFYHPWSGGINSDGHPHLTATMTKPTVGKTIAISSSLVRKGWLGRRVYIEGLGVFTAEDRMNKDLKGDRVDICVASKKEAFRRGKLKNVLITVLEG